MLLGLYRFLETNGMIVSSSWCPKERSLEPDVAKLKSLKCVDSFLLCVFLHSGAPCVFRNVHEHRGRSVTLNASRLYEHVARIAYGPAGAPAERWEILPYTPMRFSATWFSVGLWLDLMNLKVSSTLMFLWNLTSEAQRLSCGRLQVLPTLANTRTSHQRRSDRNSASRSDNSVTSWG